MRPEAAALDSERAARRLVTEASYLTLATADSSGAPWASPVWFAARGIDSFVWASKPGARHSRNIAENPRVSLVVFDSSLPPGEGTALYIAADAAPVDESGFDDALETYRTRSLERGLGDWEASRLRAPARHRLYRAVTREAFVLDDHDERIPVPRSGPPAPLPE